MKEFNLEKALAGEPVVTRDGRQVKIAGYNKDGENYSKIVGWVNEIAYTWTEYGKCFGGSGDLFMAEKPKVKKEGFVIMDMCERMKTMIYETEEHAKSLAKEGMTVAKMIWEEEA